MTVHVLTVDHRLRAEAAKEAEQVAAWAAAIGLKHVMLAWTEGEAHRHKASSAQAAARAARYALMLEWCKAQGCRHLFLGHHADDQTETFFLRLARGSGVDGLAAMAPVTIREGVRLTRPLLEIPKSRLVAYCREVGQGWIEDPSNSNETYGRVRIRAGRDLLEREGFTAARVLSTTRHLQRARNALDHYVRGLITDSCSWDRFGIAHLDLEGLKAAPDEVALRALAAVLCAAGGQTYRPRFERLYRLFATLRTGPWRDATLHGCKVVREGPHLIIAREAAQISDEQILTGAGPVVWDRRFKVEVAGTSADARFVVRPPTAAMPKDAAVLPALARGTVPAIFDSAGLAAVPVVNYIRADLTTCPSVTFRAAFLCPGIDQFPEDDAEL